MANEIFEALHILEKERGIPLDFVVFVVADIGIAVLRTLQNTDLNVGCCRLMLVEHFCGKEVTCMPDMKS